MLPIKDGVLIDQHESKITTVVFMRSGVFILVDKMDYEILM